MPGEAMTMQAAMTHMGAAHDAPTPAQPDRHLLICCTPRTASATLASLLSAGGNLCHSAEYFSVPAEKRYNLRPGVAPAPVRRGAINPGYFHRILPLRTSHGVFSTRVHASHLKRVTAAGLGRELLDKVVLVYLCRGKLQDQAISYTIAQVTKDWGNHEQHSLKNEPDMQKLTAVYVRNLR